MRETQLVDVPIGLQSARKRQVGYVLPAPVGVQTRRIRRGEGHASVDIQIQPVAAQHQAGDLKRVATHPGLQGETVDTAIEAFGGDADVAQHGVVERDVEGQLECERLAVGLGIVCALGDDDVDLPGPELGDGDVPCQQLQQPDVDLDVANAHGHRLARPVDGFDR